MAGKTNKAGQGLTIAAVMILLLGLGFGILKISQGIRAYRAMPTEEQMTGRQEYIQALEALERILETVEDVESLEAEQLLQGYLTDTYMTVRQQDDLLEIYKAVLQKAKGGYVEREMARNTITREIIYARNQTDREGARQQATRMLILGGGSIAVVILVAVPVLSAAGKKKKTAKPAETAPDTDASAVKIAESAKYNQKER